MHPEFAAMGGVVSGDVARGIAGRRLLPDLEVGESIPIAIIRTQRAFARGECELTAGTGPA